MINLPLLLFFLAAGCTGALASAAPDGTLRVAVVTGASRGIGWGIASELDEAGYAVYALGQSSRKSAATPAGQRPVAEGLDLTVESTAKEVTRRGGRGIAVPCDLSQDWVIEEAIEKIVKEQGRLDVLVHDVIGDEPPEGFWKQGLDMWDVVNGATMALYPGLVWTEANL